MHFIENNRELLLALDGKQLLLDVLESFEFQRISSGIEKEHGRLLPRLSLEPNVRFNDKVDTSIPKSARQVFPLRHPQHYSTMRNWYAVPIYWVGMRTDCPIVANLIVEMANKLVSEQIKIDPRVVTSPLRASQ